MVKEQQTINTKRFLCLNPVRLKQYGLTFLLVIVNLGYKMELTSSMIIINPSSLS